MATDALRCLAVMNYTDMEAKVREATNNEPWGASSTLMQEIANGTFNYQTLNEIMPMIYRRFTEKTAEEWRQIYKSLQLLEFLIKHGSERVIDDARGHITLLKMLRQFHYIDQNGKDQGINVRNRAKELADLLGDVERIRAERKKARANKAKYTGVEGGSMGAFSGSSGRYGGFGSESAGHGGPGASYGGYSGGVYGDGGGFGGQTDEWREPGSRGADKFEEYDEYDEGATTSSPSRSKQADRAERVGVKKTTPSVPPKKKEPEVDLFSFDDAAAAPAASSTGATQASSASSGLADLSGPAGDDDDFDDFQSASPAAPVSAAPSNFAIQPPLMTSTAHSTAQFAAPKPVSAPQQASLTGIMALSPPASTTSTPVANYSSFNSPAPMSAGISGPPKPMGYQAATPNYFQSVQVPQSTGPSGGSLSSASSMPSGMSAHNKPAAPALAKPSSGADPFANLWGQAGSGLKKPTTAAGPKMGQLAKEKTSASLWGAPAASAPKPAGNTNTSSSGLDDLLG
ncbi:hypothetical protein F4777DRAFT_209379 [Nemania sp. FL0916]|nr:hypothetical protein F4777DRAFT_209379 [Nemania sp. FL0916]